MQYPEQAIYAGISQPNYAGVVPQASAPTAVPQASVPTAVPYQYPPSPAETDFPAPQNACVKRVIIPAEAGGFLTIAFPQAMPLELEKSRATITSSVYAGHITTINSIFAEKSPVAYILLGLAILALIVGIVVGVAFYEMPTLLFAIFGGFVAATIFLFGAFAVATALESKARTVRAYCDALRRDGLRWTLQSTEEYIGEDTDFYVESLGVQHGAGMHVAGMHGAGMHGAGMRGVGMHGAGMHGAGMHGAGMHGVGMHGVGMHGAGMHGAGMHGAGMHGAGMHGVGMHGAGMHGAGMHGAGMHHGYSHGISQQQAVAGHSSTRAQYKTKYYLVIEFE